MLFYYNVIMVKYNLFVFYELDYYISIIAIAIFQIIYKLSYF